LGATLPDRPRRRLAATPRSSREKGARVRINGDLYPVIASVSASHCVLEIGKEERVKISDTATFFRLAAGSPPRRCLRILWCLRLRPHHAPQPLLPRHIV